MFLEIKINDESRLVIGRVELLSGWACESTVGRLVFAWEPENGVRLL